MEIDSEEVNKKKVVWTKKKKMYIETIVIHYFHESEDPKRIVFSTKPR